MVRVFDKSQWLFVLLGIESAKHDGVVRGCPTRTLWSTAGAAEWFIIHLLLILLCQFPAHD